jgi:ADP-ribose pyrophosphatase
MKPWHTTSCEPIFTHPLLRLERRHIERDDQRREILALDADDWVNVLPLLPGDRVVMVRQFRYATESFHLELPGGIVDPGCSHRQAVEQELAEETGYAAGSLERIGEVEPNPAILDNRLSVWVATDLERLAPEDRPPTDEHEELEVVEVPLAQIPERVRRGEIRHALMLSSFYLFELSRRP